jgi:tetratricopeptide (TPR) repeat protein
MPSEENAKPAQLQTYEEYIREGWALHASRKDEDGAEEYFRQAATANPNSVDAYYGLGLVLKAQDRRQEALQVFQKVLELLDSNVIDDRVRAGMLRRLTLGHINQIKTGDWGLDKEIWKRANEPS